MATYYDPDSDYATHFLYRSGVVEANNGFRYLPQYFVAVFDDGVLLDCGVLATETYHDFRFYAADGRDGYERLLLIAAERFTWDHDGGYEIHIGELK